MPVPVNSLLQGTYQKFTPEHAGRIWAVNKRVEDDSDNNTRVYVKGNWAGASFKVLLSPNGRDWFDIDGVDLITADSTFVVPGTHGSFLGFELTNMGVGGEISMWVL